jgi:osmotically-inducible protein OsmY
MNVQTGKGWKRSGMRSNDYGRSPDHDHDRRNYSSIGKFYGRGPKGYKRSDESIKEEACELLFWSSDVDASEMEVSIADGCIFLDGFVPSRYAKKEAESMVEKIEGISDVFNRLRVKTENPQ